MKMACFVAALALPASAQVACIPAEQGMQALNSIHQSAAFLGEDHAGKPVFFVAADPSGKAWSAYILSEHNGKPYICPISAGSGFAIVPNAPGTPG